MIYGDRKTGIIVTGATGRQGEYHIGLMNEYARQVGGRGVVAGVTPKKGGRSVSGARSITRLKRHSGSRTRLQP